MNGDFLPLITLHMSSIIRITFNIFIKWSMHPTKPYKIQLNYFRIRTSNTVNCDDEVNQLDSIYTCKARNSFMDRFTIFVSCCTVFFFFFVTSCRSSEKWLFIQSLFTINCFLFVGYSLVLRFNRNMPTKIEYFRTLIHSTKGS